MRNLTKLLVVLMLIVFSQWLVPAKPYHAEADVSPRSRPRLRPLLLEDAYTFLGFPQQRAETALQAAMDYASWSKLAFETYRDGNWEVYLALGDGSQQTRLTFHSAQDIHPSLNRGCGQVVFASKRDGDYDIYKMNADGSGLVVLTSNNTDDVMPAWSWDGTKIAFQAYRDGQAEVYVMNADGSGQTRLTTNPGYDGEPDWSPDGSKIAYTSYQGGGYRIWGMNADGSGQVQLSSQAYSENPTWSPDGSRIAYDSDGNGDTWLELWVMNANGSSQLQVYDPPEAQTDAWARDWSPDGLYLTFTRISWIYYSGQWYWQSAYADAYQVGTSSYIRLSSSGLDWNPVWQSCDNKQPVSQVLTLPAYSRAAGFDVEWAGADSGLAGIKDYDVQFRLGAGGLWQDWQMGTAGKLAGFTGTPGDTVFFRSRARDRAYNLESWPASSSGDASTMLYAWNLTGKAIDNRANPFPVAAVQITPTALHSVQTDRWGFFHAHLPDTFTYTLAISKPGYASFPAAKLPMDVDRNYELYAPPEDDLVQNGGFENGLGGWQTQIAPIAVTGTHITTSAPAHTGSLALYAGPDCAPPCLSEPVTITLSTAALSMAADETGQLHFAYWDYQDPGLYYRTRSSSGDWSTAVKIASIADPNFDSALTFDAQGNLHVVWDDQGPLFHARKPSGSDSWTAPEQIGLVGRSPAAAADSLGGLHVVAFGPSNILYFYRTPAGIWQPSQVISGEQAYYSPGLTVGPDNTVHFIWQEIANLQSGVFYRAKLPSGELTEIQSLFLEFGHTNAPQVIVSDSSGGLHAYWQWGHGGYYAHRPGGGKWSAAQPLPHANGHAFLAVDSLDSVHMIGWSAQEGYYYRVKEYQGNWGAPLLLHTYPYSPAELKFNVVNDELHLLRGDWVNLKLVYQTKLHAAAASSAALQQAIQLSPSVHQPTLAFMYSWGGMKRDGDAHLSLSISAGLDTTQLMTATEVTGWRHAWFDLSAWAGKQVTLTFGVVQPAGEPYGVLYLDDVSLGSWNTPVISAALPARLSEWTGAVLTIHGDNFIQTPTVWLGDTALLNVQWQDAHTLTASIPAGILPGTYDLWVFNPGGQAGVYPGGVVLGTKVLLPALFSSDW